MSQEIKIAVDFMGGDNSASFVLPGLNLLVERHPNVRFNIYGDAKILKAELLKYSNLNSLSSIINCETFIRMDEKPSAAIKRGRESSSIWKSIDSVKVGASDFAISAGNTGALMAMSTLILRTLKGIQRPAIAAVWPTVNGETIVLDVGATIETSSKQLIDFSVLGASMAQIIFDTEIPTVSLLNIGEEDIKGLDGIKNANNQLKSGDYFFKYKGFAEGSDIGKGVSDVIVTDGFTGNIALKTAEGTASQISRYFKDSIERSIMARIGYLFAKGAFDTLKEKMNPSRLNGGIFLGLNGLVIKSHGQTDSIGFASAVELGIEMQNSGIMKTLQRNIEKSIAEVSFD